MKKQRRWMQSAIATAAITDLAFPWTRRNATLATVSLPSNNLRPAAYAISPKVAAR